MPGPNLRFGIGPLVQAGQIGPLPGPAVAEQPERTHAALARLRPRTGAFVLRLNRFFWSDGEAGIQRYLDLARRFTDRGYLVELQVRYHPSPEQEGDIPALDCATCARWYGASVPTRAWWRCRSPTR